MFPIIKMVEDWKRQKNDPVKIFLNRFLHYEITMDEIIDAVSGKMIVDFHSALGTRYIGDNLLEGNVSVEFKRADVIFMLRKYLAGEITLAILSDWAAFIFLSGLYVLDVEEYTDLDPGDNPVWDILQQLMSPSIFGIGDRNSIEHLLIELGDHSST